MGFGVTWCFLSSLDWCGVGIIYYFAHVFDDLVGCVNISGGNWCFLG